MEGYEVSAKFSFFIKAEEHNKTSALQASQ